MNIALTTPIRILLVERLKRNPRSDTIPLPLHHEDIIDAVLEHVYAETAAGRPIEYKADGRVIIKDMKERR